MQENPGHARLLEAIRREAPKLRELHSRANDEWGYEDPIYRFYHHSFKVFGLQRLTAEIVGTLQDLMPTRELAAGFMEIIAQGTGKEFSVEMNPDWSRHARPILEAFFHARFFLEMAVRYADLEKAPATLPSGWAALLCLYQLR